MTGPLKLPIQLPPQPKFILHQAKSDTCLRMNVVDGDTWVLVGESAETLFWRKVREDDGEQPREPESE